MTSQTSSSKTAPSKKEPSKIEKPQPKMTPGADYYWQSASNNRFVLPHCCDCDTVFFYPRMWCPACFSQKLDWHEASGNGKVYSFSVVHQAPFPAYQGDVPYVLAIIELEEGPRMMANVLHCDPEKVTIEMPVRVIFEDRGDMKIPQFQSISG